jgi:regulator of sigma E protease
LHISTFLSVFYFFALLGVMVFIHELGHFVVAKLCGVRVEAFALGFGKRLFGYRAKSGTDYRVNMLPLGGYVKMTGEIEMAGVVLTEEKDRNSADNGDFNAKPRWQRALIALAGPIANFVLAFVAFTCVAMFHHDVPEGLQGPAVVDYVSANSEAAKAGMQPGDTIVHFDTVENPTWEDVLPHSVLHLNRKVALGFTHNGQRTDTQILVTSPDGPENFSPSDIGFAPRIQSQPVGVLALLEDGPAIKAGLKAGDKIVAIDNLPLRSVESFLAYLKDQNGKAVVLTVQRGAEQLKLPLQPTEGEVAPGRRQFRIGFRPAAPVSRVVHLPLGTAMADAWQDTKRTSLLIVDVIHGMFTREVSVRSVSGPVGIYQVVDDASHSGFWPVVTVGASISINLGIFNLLPFPLLDGGMILFLLIEGVIRRDVDQQWKERIYQAAFILILIFAVFIIGNDVSKMHLFQKH